MTILPLRFVGVYSVRNSATYNTIAAVFGIFGVTLKRLNLQIMPIVVSMVLGGIMETKVRLDLSRLKTPLDMIDRPVAMIIFAMILLVIAEHIRTLVLEARNPP